jgi:hypothetical protein
MISYSLACSSLLMLLVKKFACIATVLASLCITTSIAKPTLLARQTILQQDPVIPAYINQVPSQAAKQRQLNIDALDSYYTTILTNIIESTSNEILESAPETYLTIHELQYAGRGNYFFIPYIVGLIVMIEYCRVSSQNFMMVLDQQLNHRVKNNLLVSIRPLVNRYNGIDIIQFNHDMSRQLGLILNPKQLSHQIIQQVYQAIDNSHIAIRIWKLITDKQWAKTRKHETNESIAIEAWLRSWLMDIEYALQDEFDSNIQFLSLVQ